MPHKLNAFYHASYTVSKATPTSSVILEMEKIMEKDTFDICSQPLFKDNSIMHFATKQTQMKQ